MRLYRFIERYVDKSEAAAGRIDREPVTKPNA